MKYIVACTVLGIALLAGCGKGDSANQGQESEAAKTETGLSEFELTHGIGPVKEPVNLSGINQELAEKGSKIFKTKCSACHKLEDRYVGPALGDVLETRTPTYVMNMMLNPAQMVKEHPTAKAMLAEYMTPMPDQNLTREDARAIVEFLASTQESEEGSEEHSEDQDEHSEDQ